MCNFSSKNIANMPRQWKEKSNKPIVCLNYFSCELVSSIAPWSKEKYEWNIIWQFKIVNCYKEKPKLYFAVIGIRIAATAETRKLEMENGWNNTKRAKTPCFHCGPTIMNCRW